MASETSMMLLIASLTLVGTLIASQPLQAAGQMGRISGQVTEDGTITPIAGARVFVVLDGDLSTPAGPPAASVTDQDDRSHVDTLPEGRYPIAAQKAGFAPPMEPSTMQMFKVAAPQALDGLTVSLRRGGVLTGRVLDSLGQPLAVPLKTDYVNSPPIGDSRYLHRIGIAAAGDVAIRAVRTLDVNSPKDAEWGAAERRLFDTLEAMNRPRAGLLLQYESRIPREDGGDVMLFEAVSERRSVRLVVSDNERGHFVLLKDSGTDRDRELVGALVPLGAIRGFDRLTVLAWESGYDGGRYSIVTITAEGLARMISAGGGGC